MQCVPESALPLGLHPEPHLPSHAHRHPRPHSHMFLWQQCYKMCYNLLQKQKSRNVDVTVIKKYLKNIISPFPVPHLVKEGLRNEQTPGVPNTTLSTYGCPHRLELSPRQNTAKTACSGHAPPWEMGNIQQCCQGGPSHFLQRNTSGTRGLGFAERLVYIIAGVALGPCAGPRK